MKPVIFLNTAWMEFYDGIDNGEKVHGGGSYVAENGYGSEIFNFKKIGDKVYGFAQPGGYNNLERLGAKPGVDKIDSVLVIFTASPENGGTYVVGWYKNATFYRNEQIEQIEDRKYNDEYIGYYAVADAKDAKLLSIDERYGLEVPRGHKGTMGRSNVWYADTAEAAPFREFVLEYINNYDRVDKIKKNRVFHRTADAEQRKKIEQAAIAFTTKYYNELGYKIKSVEKDNVGWDLEAKLGTKILHIEVKGLSGSDIFVELTPNEHAHMKQLDKDYRLCVVINALTEPILHTFTYSFEKGNWLNQDGEILVIEEITMAHCHL